MSPEKEAHTSSQRYLHPYSAAILRAKKGSNTSSCEQLLRPSSYVDIPLQSFSACPSPTNHLFPDWHGQPRKPTKRLRAIDDRVLALSVTITLGLLVLIAVPLCAILPPQYVVPLPVNILIPFYVYPNPGAFDRLYSAFVKHAEHNFTVILSVNHGPSEAAWPSGIFVNTIKRLNKFPNVKTIGYIDVDYGNRDNATVRKEIAIYAGWNNSDIALSGIFLDHTPAIDNGDARAYLKNVSATVRHSEGFREPALVVHNPGKIPDVNMTSYHADVTVVYEGEFQDLPSREKMRTELRGLGGRREDYAEWVHSVPGRVTRGGMRRIINAARRDIEWMFLTDRQGRDKYEGYGDRLEEFLDLIE